MLSCHEINLLIVDIFTMMVRIKSVYWWCSYCWMSTRFWLLSSRWSICRSVNHVTSHYFYLIRLSSIYLIDKIFRSYTDIIRKWWNRLFVLNNLFILSCSLIHSFTHAVVLRSMIFVSINFVRVWHELIFVIASIEFVSSSIHRIFVISLCS
jgi:hypothetical protein